MEVEGSFDNWTTCQPLQRSGKDFTIIKLLPPGVYQVCIQPVSCCSLLEREGTKSFCDSIWLSPLLAGIDDAVQIHC